MKYMIECSGALNISSLGKHRVRTEAWMRFRASPFGSAAFAFLVALGAPGCQSAGEDSQGSGPGPTPSSEERGTTGDPSSEGGGKGEFTPAPGSLRLLTAEQY